MEDFIWEASGMVRHSLQIRPAEPSAEGGDALWPALPAPAFICSAVVALGPPLGEMWPLLLPMSLQGAPLPLLELLTAASVLLQSPFFL